MRILILSFYFRPDLSAGSFRATSLVESLRTLVPAGSDIDVLTTLPNRYHSFSVEAPEEESQGPVRIRRIALPSHRSGMRDQARSFLTFARQVRKAVRGRTYDVVFATSSRLMTAVLGAHIATRVKAPLYLDIRDIFADTIKDVLSEPVAPVAQVLFAALERVPINQAARVNLVSGGFLPYFTSRYPRQHFSCISNGIDDEFVMAAPQVPAPAPRHAGPGTITALYAGNLGEGQGLHRIVPQLAQRLGDRVRFIVIGDGGRRGVLADAVTGMSNVELRPPVPRSQLLQAYQSADVLFLHLNAYDAFDKVLPSKFFEYGAMGKPIWAGVSGFSAEFTRRELSNAEVFAPCNVEAAIAALDRLTIADQPRAEFVARFARARVSMELARDVLSVAKTG